MRWAACSPTTGCGGTSWSGGGDGRGHFHGTGSSSRSCPLSITLDACNTRRRIYFMERWPRISIVTSCLNQAQDIGAAIESAIAQHYPDLEHIVIDGGSTDGTLQVLERYPHLKLVSEPGLGRAKAINSGFRLATGDVWGILDPPDTLLPGALARIASEVDHRQGRDVMMGRCRFVDDRGALIGVGHPG